jgi:hypothetical protein
MSTRVESLGPSRLGVSESEATLPTGVTAPSKAAFRSSAAFKACSGVI